MVIWWHPRSREMYTTDPVHAMRWYGEDYLRYAVVVPVGFDAIAWCKRPMVLT